MSTQPAAPEMLDVTISVNHDVFDGVPRARFAGDLLILSKAAKASDLYCHMRAPPAP
jgi:hypothetical protein